VRIFCLRFQETRQAIQEEKALDVPAPAAAPAEFRMSDARAPLARVFQLSPEGTPQNIQEIVNAVRTIAEVTRVVMFTPVNRIAVRSTPEQMAATEWIVRALESPGSPRSTVEYSFGGPTPVIRVFYLDPGAAPTRLAELANAIRSVAGINRLIIYQPGRAIAARGTQDRLIAAQRILDENGWR
jgi:hypothetical protein